jgi:hypothetical protein
MVWNLRNMACVLPERMKRGLKEECFEGSGSNKGI